jgi:hypothetical protein
MDQSMTSPTIGFTTFAFLMALGGAPCAQPVPRCRCTVDWLDRPYFDPPSYEPLVQKENPHGARFEIARHCPWER